MKKHFLTLLDYEKWANDHIITLTQKVESLPPKVKAIFSHLFNAHMIWYNRLTEQTNSTSVWAASEPNEWQQISDRHMQLFQAYIQKLEDEDFSNQIHYKNSKGRQYSSTIYEVLTHLSIHSSYHRGQIVVLLRPMVDEVPATDFIFYLR